jgi:hypothetical protein
MGVSGQHHAPAALLPPGKGPPVPIGQEAGWAPRAGLDTEDRGKILCPRRESNPDRPVVQPVVRHYTGWANPAPLKIVENGNKNKTKNAKKEKRERKKEKCLVLLLRIGEVPGSSLDLETEYLDSVFSWLSSVSSSKCRESSILN